MNADPKTAKAIFLEAVERHTPDQWPAFLDSACIGQPKLRGKVEALLQAHQEVGTAQHREFAEEADLRPAATSDVSTTEAPGTAIGPYKLIEQIGEGGMGTVWIAQQTEPVKRLVAVKLIRAGMDSKQVIARFEAERQALALMDHPNIAKVLDAGTIGEPEAQAREVAKSLACASGSPRPFFVMELVRGVPITKYCDEHHLTPRQRLELFVPVCQAVQHAHQKGVIHRDIKPSNVLVALYDGKPAPKVIDFGVAKAAGQSLTDKTLVTGFGAIVGTLEYMSPEQAETNQLDIDTRSDIYSLGVLLYELLTGSTPFSKKDLEKAGMLEMLRVIREDEPSKPSTKLSSSDALPTLSANRGTEPAKLTRLVRGELDWIVMKALEKDRNRRYETANGFATDVQRYLADEPVQACPPSAAYRLKKFVRRNMGPVVAAALVAIALLAGIIGTAFGLVRAEQRAEGERQARDSAEKRLSQIEKGVALFAGLVRGLDPRGEQLGAPPLYQQLRERASNAADQLVGEAVGDAEVVARLQTLLGSTLREMGDAGKAIELLQRARATREARLGSAHFDTLTTQKELALAYGRARKLPEAITLLEQVRDTLEKTPPVNYPSNKSYEWMLAECHKHRGIAFADQRKFPESEGAFREAVRFAQTLGDDRGAQAMLAQCYGSLGNSLLESNKLAAAKESYLKAQEINERLSDRFPNALDYAVGLGGSYCNFGHLVSDSGQPPEALAWFDKAIERLKPVVAHEKRLIIARTFLRNSHYGRALAFARLGQHVEAIPDWERALELDDGSMRDVLATGLSRSRLYKSRTEEDAAGCLAAAAEYEAGKGTDVEWLYNAACNRAVCAAVIPVDPKTPAADANRLAKEEADKAMVWLAKSVAAGWKDVAHMKKDAALMSLRDREDFKNLLTELETRKN